MKLISMLLVAVTISGCAADRPYEPPIDTRLQDPLPDKAIVYLLRAPHDSAAVEVAVNGEVVAKLPASSYTVVALAPGTHRLTTSATSNRAQIAPPFLIEVASNSRRFFHLSGVTSESVAVQAIVPIGGAVVPFLAPAITTREGRSWKEVAELDAQGLMSIARLVLPERGAL